MSLRSTKITAFVILGLDLIGMTIIFPLLPDFETHFHVSKLMIGIMSSLYALFAFLSAPLLGRWSDRVGRKKALAISMFWSAIGWFMTAFAPSFGWVIAGRIIDGFTAGNITIVQAILTDVATSKKERTKYYSWISVMFGLAFVVGPFLGSVLNAISFSMPFIVTGSICLLTTLLVIFVLKETLITTDKNVELSNKGFFPVFHALGHSKMAFYLWLGIIIQLGNNIGRSTYSLYLEAFYHLNIQHIGYFFTIIGIFMAFCQTVFLGRFWLKKFSPKHILFINIVAAALIYLIIAIYDQYNAMPKILVRTLLECVLIFFTISVWPVLQSEGIQHAKPHEKGETSGYFTSVFNLVGIIAPLLGSYLIQTMISPMWFAGAFSLLSLVIFWLYRYRFDEKIEELH